MMNLGGEQIALIATAIVSLVSAIAVALISKKPQAKSQVDEYGFFYDQYQILYEGVLKDAETLREKKKSLIAEIKELKEQISLLEETVKLYEKELTEMDTELQYWIDEAKLAYKIIDKEI